jgi:hypothetical protein
VTRQYGKYGGGKGASSPSLSRSRATPGSGCGGERGGPGQERSGPAGAAAHLLSGSGRAPAGFPGNLVGMGPGGERSRSWTSALGRVGVEQRADGGRGRRGATSPAGPGAQPRLPLANFFLPTEMLLRLPPHPTALADIQETQAERPLPNSVVV